MKILTLRELYSFEEGTIFVTNFDNNDPLFELWIDDGQIRVGEYDVFNYDNYAHITIEWLDGTFALKDDYYKMIME